MGLFQNQRGSSLMVTMVVVVVLSVLVAAALIFTGKEAASASQHKRREAVSACSSAARNWVLSQIAMGAQGRLNNLNIEGEHDTGQYLIRTGHLDTASAERGLEQCPASMMGGAMKDITNTTLGPGGGISGTRQCYRVIASCIEKATGDQSEVEFMVKLAL